MPGWKKIRKLAVDSILLYNNSMNTSRWYKEYSDGREVRYYHITGDYGSEHLSATEVLYDTLLHRVLKQESAIYETKWWMQQELENRVHEVPETAVPFLMAF